MHLHYTVFNCKHHVFLCQENVYSNNAYSEALNCTCIWHNMYRLKCFEVPVKLDLANKESGALIICTLQLSYRAV